MKKLIFLFCILSTLFIFYRAPQAQAAAKVSLVLLEFDPEELLAGAPFEIVFRLKNTGDEPITPFAEVTISGYIYDREGVEALRVIEKQFKVYNFWPDAQSGRHRMLIGPVAQAGIYTMDLNINVYNRVKNNNVYQGSFKWILDVK